MNKDYTRGLARNKEWRERRKGLMQKYGKPALNGTLPPCHSARSVPCRQKPVGKKNENNEQED